MAGKKKRIIKTDEPYLVSGGDGNEKAETKDRQTAATNYRHCLPFFFIGDGRRRASGESSAAGAAGAAFCILQQALADGDEIGFAAIFWKYLKYVSSSG